MYLDNDDYRFGIGRFTTEAEVEYTAEKCIEHVSRLREMRYVIHHQISWIHISVRYVNFIHVSLSNI